MNSQQYQRHVQRTTPAHPHTKQLLCLGLGIAGEAGEIAELVKKAVCHGHPISRPQLNEELGDLLWYVAAIANYYQLDLKKIMHSNIDKLNKRYPNGFNSQDSIKRRDK